MRIRGLGVAVAAAAALVSITASAGGPIFTPGNIVVFRAGNGVALSNLGNPIFLDEYTTAGSLVQSVSLPTTTSGANRQCVTAGTATSEGLISLSTDGQYIVGACYASDIPAASSLTAATSASVPRVLFRVSNDGSINTTTALTDFGSTGNPRSAVSTNGTDLWGTSSNTGVHYAAIGSTTSTQLAVTPTNLRQMGIAGGQLLVSANTGAFRLASIGSGTPTTNGQTITNLTGLPTATVSPYGFVGLDRSASVAGIDTIYFADDRAAPNGGVYKYSFDGATWTARGFIAGSLRGLTGKINGANVVMYATGTAATANTLVTANDTALFDATISGTITTIGTGAPVATAFRGVAFVPQPAAVSPTLTIAAVSVAEGNVGCAGGTTALNFTVTSSSAAPVGGINFTFSTTDGTAAAASDFSTTGAGTIAAAATTGTASVLVNCDNDYEESETFTVTLIDGATYDLGATFSNTGTIINDDPTPYVVAVSSLSVQELNGLAATGTSSSLPTGYVFSETGGNATYSADDGSSAAGGVYSYGTGSDRALGTLRDGTVTPFIGVRLQNGTGDVIKYLWVQYAGEQWRRDSATATPDRLDFQYSTNATSLADPAATWTDVDALDFASPITSAASTALDGNAAANRTSINSFIETLNVANNATFWIRWADADAAGNDDGLAIDSVTIMVPTLDIDAAESLTEGNIAGCPVPNNLRFLVSRGGSVPSTGIPYTFTTTAVSAAQNIDYTGFTNEPKTLNFGGTVSFIDVPITCDDTDESDETFTVTIATVAGSGYFVLPGSSVGTATIVDDDVSGTNPNIAIGDVIAVETNTATTSFSFPVTLSAPAVSNVTFTASTSDGSATTANNDYIALVAVAGSIPATQTSTTVTVTVNGDSAIEGNENFTVTLAAVTNVAASGNDLSATGTISNDDIPTFSIDNVSLSEGNGGTTPFIFTVTLSEPPASGSVTVDYQTANSSATTPADYATTSGTLSFDAANLTRTITVLVAGETAVESDESFFVNLSNAVGATIFDAQGIGTIVDDDLTTYRIHEIQGAGAFSTFDPNPADTNPGQIVRVADAVVTAVTKVLAVDGSPADGNAFFMQSTNAHADANALTSEGIYVFTNTAPTVQIGDIVTVIGQVQERFGQTQLTNLTSVTITGTTLTLPNAVEFSAGSGIPSTNPSVLSCLGTGPGGANNSDTNFECFEGMRVSMPDAVVTRANQRRAADVYGEVFVMPTAERARRERGVLWPSVTGAGNATAGQFDGNPELLEMDADEAGLTVAEITAGTMFNAVGVIGYSFGDYEFYPTELNIVQAQPVPEAVMATAGGNELTIASFNAQHLCDAAASTPQCNRDTTGAGGSVLSYADKLVKVSSYVRTVLGSPDVIGLQEVDRLTTLQDLAARITTDGGPTYSSFLIEGNDPGDIDVGFMVRNDRVSVSPTDVVQFHKNDMWADPNGSDILHDRPPLLMRAMFNAPGGSYPFAVMNNHTKARTTVDNNNPAAERDRAKRFLQARDIANLTQEFQTATGRFAGQGTNTVPLILVGDYNAFEHTDGYVDVVGLIAGTYDDAANECNAILSDMGSTVINCNLGANIVVPSLFNTALSVPKDERISYLFTQNFGDVQGYQRPNTSNPPGPFNAARDVPAVQVIDHILLARNAQGFFVGTDFGVANNASSDEATRTNTGPINSSDHDGLVTYLDFNCASNPSLNPDGDQICGMLDNCPNVANNGQADLDGDGEGDACDNDIDGDGDLNISDNCPLIVNSDQADADGDGVGDVCDPFPNDSQLLFRDGFE